MKTRSAILAFAFALGVGAGLHGCSPDRSYIQIQEVCAPPDTCAFSGACGAAYISWPTVDAGVTGALTLYLQVANQLPNNGDVKTGRLNTNGAHVDETLIVYDGIAIPQALIGSNFWIPANGTSVIKVDVIPVAALAQGLLSAFAPTTVPREMVARLKMRGYLDDGTRFETGEFAITVRVCTGCVGAAVCTNGTCPPNSSGQLPLVCTA